MDILFADDDAAMRAMVADVLGASGYEVRLAFNGSEALAEMRRMVPDLAVLDYRMGAMDGFAVCREAKSDARLEHVPILMLTGDHEVEQRVMAFEAGADDFLAKPFEPRELVARCKALLRLARQGLDRNPTTSLPGGDALKRELERRLERSAAFHLCYLDLDHLKPFHDRFGFVVADEMIRSTGRALAAIAARDACFVGHVGGDDFVLLTTSTLAVRQVEELQKAVRESLATQLPADVVTAGVYRSADREGVEREFPMLRLSAAVIRVEPDGIDSLENFGAEIARAKTEAKRSESGIAEMRLPTSAASPRQA